MLGFFFFFWGGGGGGVGGFFCFFLNWLGGSVPFLSTRL